VPNSFASTGSLGVPPWAQRLLDLDAWLACCCVSFTVTAPASDREPIGRTFLCR